MQPIPGLNGLFNALTGNGVNKRDDLGETRLYRAVRRGSLGEVRKLLREGADPNIQNAQGLSPLHLAAYWGETEIAETLLKAGANVNANNGKGWTPLHSAAISGGLKMRKPVIELLRKKGAREDIADKNGWRATDYMVLWQENAAAAEKLLQFAALDMAGAPEEGRKVPRFKPADFKKH